MVDERTAYWGERDAARYRTRDDDPTGGDYVVAETLDANGDPVDVLLRWDDTAGEWVSGGPVNMSGSDVANVGALDADSVSTGQVNLDRGGTVNNLADSYICSLEFGSNEGWTSYVEVTHNGSDDGAFFGFFRVLFESISGGTPVDETGTLITVNNDAGGFGSTGATTSISNHLRFKVDDNDSLTAYIQVNRDQDFIHGLFQGDYLGRSGVSTTALDPI